MPAVVVEDITILPRVPEPDPSIARSRPVRQRHERPARVRGRRLPGAPGIRWGGPGGARPVHPPRPDGRGRVRAGRAEGHPMASPPRIRDSHLHDRRCLRARRLQRRRWRHHQRRHAVDDGRSRDPPYREAAGMAGRERRAVPRPPAVGQPAGRPEADHTALPGPARERGRPGLVAGRRRPDPRHRRGRGRSRRSGFHVFTDDDGSRDAESRAHVSLPWRPDYNALVYVLAGQGSVGPEARPIGTGQLAVLGDGNALTVAALPVQESGPRTWTSSSSADGRSASRSPGWARS